MEVVAGDRAVRSNVVKRGDAGLSSKLVDQLGLPEKHDMLLVLGRFFDFSSIKVTGLFFSTLKISPKAPLPSFFMILKRPSRISWPS